MGINRFSEKPYTKRFIRLLSILLTIAVIMMLTGCDEDEAYDAAEDYWNDNY